MDGCLTETGLTITPTSAIQQHHEFNLSNGSPPLAQDHRIRLPFGPGRDRLTLAREGTTITLFTLQERTQR